MKRGLVLVALIFSLGLVSAGFFSTITGRVIEGLEDNISNMSEEEIAQLYKENKDYVNSLDKEDIDSAIEENKDLIPDEVIDVYENKSGILLDLAVDEESIKEMILENGNVSLAVIFDIFPCSMISEFVEPQVVGVEIPEEVPLEDDVFNFYIDNEFIASIELEDKVVSDFSCEETEDFSYQILVTSELLVEVALNYNEIDAIEFYKEKKQTGDIEIRAKGLINKFKVFVLNIVVKFL